MRRHWFFILSLAAFMALAVAYFTAAHVSARGGEDSPLFSIRRHDPYGCAALFELLEKRGDDVGSLERSLPPRTFSGTLVRVFPGAGGGAGGHHRGQAPGLQAKATLKWVKNGGRLVMFTPQADDLLELAFALPPVKKAQGDAPTAAPADAPQADEQAKDDEGDGDEGEKPTPPPPPPPSKGKGKEKGGKDLAKAKPHIHSALTAAAFDMNLLEGMAHGEHPDRLLPEPAAIAWEKDAAAQTGLVPPPGHLGLASPMVLPETFPGWSVLARTAAKRRDGAKDPVKQVPVIGRLALGKGELILVGDPVPASNTGLVREGDLRLALALIEARGGPVLFDEFSHGLGASDRLMALIARFGLLPVLAQGLFCGLLFVWSTAGSPRPKTAVAPPRPRPASDQVLALGHLLAQSLNPAALLTRVPRLVRRRFTAALSVPPESLNRTLEKHPAGARARALLARADALAENAAPRHAEAEALAVLSESHDLAKELAHEHNPRR